MSLVKEMVSDVRRITLLGWSAIVVVVLLGHLALSALSPLVVGASDAAPPAAAAVVAPATPYERVALVRNCFTGLSDSDTPYVLVRENGVGYYIPSQHRIELGKLKDGDVVELPPTVASWRLLEVYSIQGAAGYTGTAGKSASWAVTDTIGDWKELKGGGHAYRMATHVYVKR